jgi:hypothetical protein
MTKFLGVWECAEALITREYDFFKSTGMGFFADYVDQGLSPDTRS